MVGKKIGSSIHVYNKKLVYKDWLSHNEIACHSSVRGFFVVSPKDVLEELVSRQEKESLKSLSDSESELLL